MAEDGGTITVVVLANDGDPDGDPLTIAAVSQAAHGSVAIGGNGTTLQYTPFANFNGSDAFAYTVVDGRGGQATAVVTVTVTPVNDPPTAAADAYATNEDTALTVAAAAGVLANDTDVDGDTLAVTGFTQAAHGTVSVASDGSFTYTPSANYNGPDAFTYTVGDGNGGSAVGTVSLTINAVNDAPVAASETYAIPVNTLVSVGLSMSDADGDPLVARLVSGPANGTLKFNPDGTLTFLPAAGFSGTTSFTY